MDVKASVSPRADAATRGELLAFAVGWRCGYDAAERAMAAAWHAMWLGTRKVLDQPTHAEIDRQRADDSPCGTKCGCCSRCIRHTAVLANLARYGQHDFPGGAP